MTAILIAGPTASGKSALALALAEKLGGVIVNADSMQVYRDLRVITARPTPAEEARAPHLLYGHVDAGRRYSVGAWRLDAGAALAEAKRTARSVILAGGTGLYFETLTKGLAAIPPTPEDIRSTVKVRLEAEGAAALHAELMDRDPAMARRLMPGDRSRIARALEVVLATGRSLADWHREGMPPALDSAQAIKIFLDPDRAELRERIEARFAAMLGAGALEEVRVLAGRGLDPALPAMKAHGVPWLIRHLAGEISLADAAAGGVRDTWRYTKRQATWFRNRMPGWSWVAPETAETSILREISRNSA
ncbi:MAG TPA: tRNA (adenosine(37)-N6)-dimethylallyltransferase MiaA [Xanthobacteraceae bacterium]